MHTRLIEPADAPALLEIYNPEIIETTVTFDLVAWDLEDARRWITEHEGAHVALVAIGEPDEEGPRGARDEVILGYAAIGPYRSRPAYATTVENSLYVARSARRGGVGTLLLTDLLHAAQAGGFHSVVARIVGENQASIQLHERCGFDHVGVEHEVGRKHGKWLDVVEMQILL